MSGSRQLAQRSLLRLARTRSGTRLVHLVVRRDPTLAIEPLGQLLNRGARFPAVVDWPPSLGGFERLAFLLSSNPLNMGIALLTLDEAAYLYRTVRDLRGGTLVEVGRFKGGSTFLIAAAMDEHAELWSYDLHVKLTHEFRGTELDVELEDALARYGLADRVHVVVGDSTSVQPPARPCDFVFIDGDHSYEGARADYEHWRPFIRPGGHLLFHDAVPQRGYGSFHPEVARLVREIGERDGDFFAEIGRGGSIIHFMRTEALNEWGA
jgi:predicted O-methyltransferase YrrM